MAYSSEISRKSPTCILFVIDQSGSMDERMVSGRSKADFVADVLNKTLATMCTTCTKSDGVRDYFDIGVIAYGGSAVATGFGGELSSKILHPISSIENAPLRIEERKKKVDDGAGGLVEQVIKFPVWFDPRNDGGTPMCQALGQAAQVLVEWCDNHPNSYPPTILHVTDGQSTDGDPESISSTLKQISTNDGQCLLFNLHVSADSSKEIIFPTSESSLPNEYARLLFRMSSNLPQSLATEARNRGHNVSSESRGFIYNAGAEFIVDFFDIGTRPLLLAAR